MILNTIMVIVLVVDVMLVYKLSVILDRVEDNLVDMEIIYTKTQNLLRDLECCVDVSAHPLPFE
jgi:hypothetical protein